MSHVFISYAREDRSFVVDLTAHLRRAGIETWTDLEGIRPGDNWQDSIVNALGRAGAVVYVSSRHSGPSGWMEYELRAALPALVPVIPLVLDDEGERTLPDALRAVQWVDFRGDYEAALGQLLAGLEHLRTSEPLPAPEPRSKGYAFISYAEEDSSFVRRLIGFMEDRGYAHWAYQFSRRKYQQLLDDELEEAISGASVTLCVMSPNWKKSKKTKQEFAFSEEVGVPVFLLRVADPGPTLAFAGRTYIDFSSDEKRGFTELGDELAQQGI